MKASTLSDTEANPKTSAFVVQTKKVGNRVLKYPIAENSPCVLSDLDVFGDPGQRLQTGHPLDVQISLVAQNHCLQ